MSRQDFGPYPAEAIGPLIEAMDALGATMPPGAVKAAQSLRTLERTGRMDVALHELFVANLTDRAVTAVMNGRSFDFSKEYLRGVPPVLDPGQFRTDRLNVLARVRNEVSEEYLGPLVAEVSRLHVQGCDSAREHVGLIPALVKVDALHPPEGVHAAQQATEHLRAVIAATALALKASGAARVKGNGSARFLGPATHARPLRTPAPVDSVERIVEVLEAVAAGPTWDEDWLIPELLEISATGSPFDEWQDSAFLVEALPA